jgi:amidohydrolase
VDKAYFQQRADQLHMQLVQWRRHFHMNPELSYQEHNTQAFIADILSAAGIRWRKVAGTGLLAEVEGAASGRVVALRGDMDALPITEVEGREYGSRNPGVMHACGHDVHTTCALGALVILNDLRNHWDGHLKVLFQPGEERLPGGATLMIADGVLENPSVDVIIAQHVFPDMPAGRVGFCAGEYMACADEIYIAISGKGGHAALPHLLIDPVLISAHVITALQQVVSRNARPGVPVVLSFGNVQANGATNIIPDVVQLVGTFRCMDEQVRLDLHQKISQTARGVAQGMGGSADVRIDLGYPVLVNDQPLTEACAAAASEYLGSDAVEKLSFRMTSEDFAWYAQKVPGCFYRLGTRNEAEGITHGLHTSRFDVDESSLRIGAGLMAWLGWKALSSPSR